MVHRVAALLFLMLLVGNASAKPPASESLLPKTTKGWISVPDVAALKANWKKTQLGKLMSDPLMKPFAQDLQRQLSEKLSKVFRLGISLDDITGIAGGELSVAVTQPGNDPKNHSLVLLVDITGKRAKVDALLKKVDTNMMGRGATRKEEQIAGKTWIVYTRPKTKQRPAIVARYLIHKDLLISTDHSVVGQQIALALDAAAQGGKRADSLLTLPRYSEVTKRTTGTDTAHIHWFVDPFGYALTTRAAAGGKKAHGKDMLKLLARQGFDAVQALGGRVTFSTSKHDILHRTFVYAPPVKRQAGDTRKDKYNLAARILDFPNAQDMTPNKIVPHNVATFLTFNWKLPKAFKHVGSLVDDYLDTPGAWKDMLDSIKLDPNGPKVDIENKIIRHLGHRAMLIVDVKKPITTKSERVLVGIKTKNFDAVRKAIDKMLKDDPSAKAIRGKRLGKITVYEFITEEAPDEVASSLQVDCLCGADEPEEVKLKGDGKCAADPPPLFPNAAIAVGHGHLMVSTHKDFLIEVIERGLKQKTKKLDAQTDFQRMTKILSGLGGPENSFRYFTRTDDAYQTTYDLLRTGKMPESQTLLGKALNRLLATDREGVAREQQIDGSKLPKFSAVKKYFGPAGLSVTSNDAGWLVVGCLLKKK